jgi:hypothetical protein
MNWGVVVWDLKRLDSPAVFGALLIVIYQLCIEFVSAIKFHRE